MSILVKNVGAIVVITIKLIVACGFMKRKGIKCSDGKIV